MILLFIVSNKEHRLIETGLKEVTGGYDTNVSLITISNLYNLWLSGIIYM